MNEFCDVCGCKTEEDSLKLFLIGGDSYCVCHFCRKQLKNIAQSPKENVDAANNILYMNTNKRRSEQCNASLRKYMVSYGIPINPVSDENTGQADVPPAPVTPPPFVPPAVGNEVEELKKQVDELSEKLNRFYKRFLLSKILGIIIPFLMVVVMLIIMLSTGALKNIFEYYGMLSEYANM